MPGKERPPRLSRLLATHQTKLLLYRGAGISLIRRRCCNTSKLQNFNTCYRRGGDVRSKSPSFPVRKSPRNRHAIWRENYIAGFNKAVAPATQQAGPSGATQPRPINFSGKAASRGRSFREKTGEDTTKKKAQIVVQKRRN